MAISFSPAGMAIKGFFGLGARTFGNPDGAKKGGGAFAAGGNNPNGPNQGGGAGGGITGTFGITSAHQQFTIPHPANVIDYYGYSNGDDTPNVPLIVTPLGSVSGALAAQIETFVENLNAITPGPPWSSGSIIFTAIGSFPQSAFTTLAVTGDNGPISLASAAASYALGLDSASRTVSNWSWSITPPAAPDFGIGNSYTITLS